MAASVHVPKRRLKNSVMHVDHFLTGSQCFYACVKWKLEKFFQMKDSMTYMKVVDKLDWCLNATKKRYHFLVKAYILERGKKVTCCVNYGLGKYSTPAELEEMDDGMYLAEIHPKMLNHPDNYHLNVEGCVVLEFRFDMRKDIANNPVASRQVKGELDQLLWARDIVLTTDLCSSRPLQPDLRDFVVLAGKKVYYVHKAVLAARSRTMAAFFRKNATAEKMRLTNTTPKAVHDLISYMYTGAIPVEVDDLIQLLKLNKLMLIPRMKTLCETVLRESIDESNVVKIRLIGVEIGSISLVDSADMLLSKYGSSDDARSVAGSEH